MLKLFFSLAAFAVVKLLKIGLKRELSLYYQQKHLPSFIN